MNTRTENLPPLRVAYLRGRGPYSQTFPKLWPRLHGFAKRRNLQPPAAMFLSIAHNNPRTTEPAQIIGDVCVTVPDGFELNPALDGEVELQLQTIPSGRFFVAEYVGPYQGLPKAWGEFCDVLMPASGHAGREGAPFEIYRTPPQGDQTVTALYLPIH